MTLPGLVNNFRRPSFSKSLGQDPTSGGLAFLKVWAKTPLQAARRPRPPVVPAENPPPNRAAGTTGLLRQVSLRRRGRDKKPTTQPRRRNNGIIKTSHPAQPGPGLTFRRPAGQDPPSFLRRTHHPTFTQERRDIRSHHPTSPQERRDNNNRILETG